MTHGGHGGDVERADRTSTRGTFTALLHQPGSRRALQSIFSSFGELYDCEVIFASGHCSSLVKNAAGTWSWTRSAFEKNPDHVWRSALSKSPLW